MPGNSESTWALTVPEVVNLWQDVLEISGHGLTMRRPITRLQATSKRRKQALSPLWWNGEVSVELEICDCTGHVIIPSSRIFCLQGDGDLPDAVELSLLCLQPGESCEVCCHTASLATELAKLSDLPLLFRVGLLSRSDIQEYNCTTCLQSLSKILRHARLLFKQKRFLLALLKLRSLRNAQLPSKKLNEESLRLLCLCGHHLNLSAAKQWADQLVDCSFLAQHLVLRARVRLFTEPQEALRDLKTAFELDRASVDSSLVQRAKQQLKRQRRAAQWFDGKDADERTLEAGSQYVCYQCNRLRKNGRVGTTGSKLEGKYLCNECWRCWSVIRYSQQMELDRRLEKAAYSDYSTATDELPSLDERPQDWDSHHPMWKRVNEQRPGWQHADLRDPPGF